MAGDAGRTDGRQELNRRRLFLAIAATYGLALLVWLIWPAFRESLIGKFVAIPVFSIYLFEHLGVPGLTERGNCDWMWCKPTALGIVLATAVWLGVAWLLAAGLARLRARRV